MASFNLTSVNSQLRIKNLVFIRFFCRRSDSCSSSRASRLRAKSGRKMHETLFRLRSRSSNEKSFVQGGSFKKRDSFINSCWKWFFEGRVVRKLLKTVVRYTVLLFIKS